MPDPYLLLSFATIGESQGTGTGAAGFAAGLRWQRLGLRQPVSEESKSLPAVKAELALLLFPIEPIQRVWISLRPELRADPPTVSVHFPAAAEWGI